MDTLVIKDFDTAIDAYIESYKQGFQWNNIEFSEEANLTIKMEGSQWDGALDYKVAEFVIKLQKTMLALYNEQTGQRLKYNTRPMDDAHLRVTVTVEPGCSWIKAAFKGMWDNMESKDKKWAIISVMAILSITAGAAYWHKCDTDVEREKISADSALEITRVEQQAEVEKKVQERLSKEADQKEVMHAIDRAFDFAEQASGSIAFLASKMQPKDSMTVSGVELSSSTAKRMFRQKPSMDELGDESCFFIDGEYPIVNINIKKREAKIQFSDKERIFSLERLDDKDEQRNLFYQACSENQKNDPLPTLTLQLTAFFRGGVFQHGFVEGVGPKRDNSKTFVEAALASASMEEDKEQDTEE